MFSGRYTYWESIEQIPEPHQFAVSVIINHGGYGTVTRPNSPSPTMVTMSAAPDTDMGTAMKRRRRMTNFMHLKCVL